MKRGKEEEGEEEEEEEEEERQSHDKTGKTLEQASIDRISVLRAKVNTTAS